MPTTITGTDGVSQVQTGAVESGDLPAGSVIQVVQGSTSTFVSTTSQSYVDTTLSASITPKSSSNQILVLVNQQAILRRGSSSSFFGIRILRNGTAVFTPVTDGAGPFDFGSANGNASKSDIYNRFSISYLDSPSSTSPVTYKTQARNYYSDQTIDLQLNNDVDGTSFITLMEIAG